MTVPHPIRRYKRFDDVKGTGFMDLRLAIRRKPQFRDDEHALRTALAHLDGVGELTDVAIIHLYDVFHADDEGCDRDALLDSVVCDARVDTAVSESELHELVARADTGEMTLLAVEPLPGQYDQRADAAGQALQLLRPATPARIYSSELYAISPALSEKALQAIRTYLINPVEAGEKDLTLLSEPDMGAPDSLAEYSDFLDLDGAGRSALIAERGMAMSEADLACIQEYFRSEGRTPTDVELAVLDTYWSDHCRHTTFNTGLTDIVNHSERFHAELERALARWQELRSANGRSGRVPTLMDLGTIMGKDLRRRDIMTTQEVSEEINACSVHITVDGEPWLLMFKNETHNHPTEIEPFGGASTCLGGAIRDPLSGRSWVYQALRLSGAGDITEPRSSTLEGKLPQADISTRATAGYSSYGNQIGLATTGVQEFVHSGYVAKRMELGAVVAAAPAANVRRLEPEAGDVVIILGGRTGRDGIGGATGSSKAHTEESLARSGAEVQKGNPVNERKIQRLFRRADVAQMIVRCNDFGAGGVAVAVGELAAGLDIHLDRVPLKYAGLNAKEIAISESQERMAVVVRAADAPLFIAAAAEENLEATVLAEVTASGRMRMFDGDEMVVDLSRAFIDTNGAPRSQAVEMRDPQVGNGGAHAPNAATPVAAASAAAVPTSVLASLAAANIASQEGMVEQFDSTVGRSTVLMPYGGILQKTKEMASIQTLPVSGGTDVASVMTYGFSPVLADDSPYLMGAYSVVEALSALSATGADPKQAWLTVQEYFQRPDSDPLVWGTVLQALLGLLEAQDAFDVAAIGGKDSMSGSFTLDDGHELHVPPTLVTFAVGTLDATKAVSATLPPRQLDLYYLPHTPLASGAPNYAQLRANFASYQQLAAAGGVVSASAIRGGNLAATVVNMCLGNAVGFFASSTSARAWLTPGSEVQQLTHNPLGGIVFAVDPLVNITPLFSVATADATACASAAGDAPADSDRPRVIYLGATTDKNHTIDLGFESFSIDEALQVSERGYASVYPINRTSAPSEPLPDFAVQIGTDHGSTADVTAGGTKSRGTSADTTAIRDTSGGSPATPAADAGEGDAAVRVLLPVFPGTNSEYDMAEAFQAAGASTEFHVIRNLTPDMLAADTATFIARLSDPSVQILAFSGGFSLGDEPDGSAKFMAAFLRSPAVAAAVTAFTRRDGLVLGVCNGFQALVKSGFLPYGDPSKLTADSPTLAHNRQLRHVSRIATTRVATAASASPWLSTFTPGQIHKVPVSHGEGRFVVSEREARQLFAAGQVAFQYVDAEGTPTMEAPENPNGSSFAIEGIISPDGKILGKMGHPERYRHGLMRNIPGIGEQSIFANAVAYCRAHTSPSAAPQSAVSGSPSH
ncbi:MAG: phosphoribosylformylglycinamidine synthase subunit PurQ [Actinomycetaceae bacterium]|nr:phosphoribosylformylglycinamidine synthase subunit PurQ [Arcanobacterium sp.]MDD7686656.1 phosphoribosylformylglycinamidine synthase subunit PurQ [Actinomycetaceae bacterium]